MEEMKGFIKQYEELVKRVENIEEVGALELRKVYDELTSLDNRSGISIENFTNDSDNDLYARLEALKQWDELKEKIRVKEIEVLDHYTARKSLLDAKFAEYRRIKEYRRENQKRINEFKFELDKHNALMNHISDSFAKDNMEDTIKDDEKHILRAEELGKKYDKEIYDLDRECRILLEGGKLAELGKLDEDEITEELDRDNNRLIEEPKKEEPKPKKKPETVEEPKEEKKEEKAVKPKKVSVKRDQEEDEEINLVLPPKPDKEEEKEEENINLVLPPLLDPVDEEEDKVLPPAKDDEEEIEVEKVLPPKPGHKRPLPPKINLEENEEKPARVLPPRIDEDLDEELVPVEAVVTKPKDKLWKKVGKAVAGAVLFLSLAGAAIASGISAHKTSKNTDLNANKEETVEETEKEQDVIRKTGTRITNEEPKVTPEVVSEETAKVAYAEPKYEEPVYEEPKYEEPVTETVEEPVKEEPKEETLDIKLAPGEEVVNTDTGVAVNYEGKAAYTDDEGNVHELENRDLEHNEDNQAIVTENDLNNEEIIDMPTEIPMIGSNERTGYEVSEEEAKANMTPEERAVAESQEEEWFRMLEESGLSR